MKKTTADGASLWPLVLVAGGLAIGYAAGQHLGWFALATIVTVWGIAWLVSHW